MELKSQIYKAEQEKDIKTLEEIQENAEIGFEGEIAGLAKAAIDRLNGKVEDAEKTPNHVVEKLGEEKVEEITAEIDKEIEGLKEKTEREIEGVVGADKSKQKEFLALEEKKLYSQFLEIDSKKQELEKQFLPIQSERRAQFEEILSERINPSAMEINKLEYKDFSENIYPKLLKNGFSKLDLSSPHIYNIIEDVKKNTDSGLIRQCLLRLASPLTIENLYLHQRALYDIIQEAKTNESRLLKRFEIGRYRNVSPSTEKLISEFKDILNNINIELKSNPNAYERKPIPQALLEKNKQEQNEYGRIIREKPEEIVKPIEYLLDIKYPEFKSLQEKYNTVNKEFNTIDHELSRVRSELIHLNEKK